MRSFNLCEIHPFWHVAVYSYGLLVTPLCCFLSARNMQLRDHHVFSICSIVDRLHVRMFCKLSPCVFSCRVHPLGSRRCYIYHLS